MAPSLTIQVVKEYNAELAAVPNKQADQYKALISGGKDEVFAKTFRTWAKRWNNTAAGPENYECSITSDAVVPLVEPDFTMASVRRLEDTTTRCHPGKREVKCVGLEYFGKKVTEYCQAKVGAEKSFIEGC